MIVGTAGHIDHGKTALVKALTGVDADRLREEKARGITIDLGFAYTPLAGERVTGFVDVPGHERFVHTMMAGASGIDLALLAIAVDDGVMPQTREHLAILDLLGIRRCIVALTKADLADDERRVSVAHEAQALLAKTSVNAEAILPVSIVTGEGLDELRALLTRAEHDTSSAAGDGRFRLSVDRCFTLTGAGVVVTGTVLSGTVAVGDRVTVSPSGLVARVRSLHAQNAPAQQGFAGQRCALNLSGDGVRKEAIARGDVVLDPFLHAPTSRIDAELQVLAGETKPIRDWFPARLHHASVEAGVRVVPLGEGIAPGTTGRVQLVLDRAIAAAAGDRFVLRDVSAQRTIGGGRFLDLRPPQRKRRAPMRLKQLDALAQDDIARALTDLLSTPPFVVDITAFGRDRALSDVQVADLARRIAIVQLDVEGAQLVLSAPIWQRFATAVEDALAAFHHENSEAQGPGRERLRLSVEPRLPAKAFVVALQHLVRENRVVLDGAFVRLPGHNVRLSGPDEASWERIVPHLRDALRFRPPRVRDIAVGLGSGETDVRRVLKLCARLGRVDQIAHDHFFLRATTVEMAQIARDCALDADEHAFTAAQFRDRMDNGRKVAIQILDFFDRHGVTLRRGDLRRINPHRADVFASEGGEGGETFPVGRPDFKSGWGSESVSGGFDSHSLPPLSSAAAAQRP